MRLKSDSLSDIGRIRKRNEDACYSDPQRGLFIIADGMDGHPAGTIASRLAVDTLQALLTTRGVLSSAQEIPKQIEQALQQTNRTVLQAGQSNPAWTRMGTTVAIAVIAAGQAFIANIGDSRIYLLRNGLLRQCSQDHNPTDPALFAGKVQNLSHLLTQAIGLEQTLEPSQQQFPVQPGDRLLLCTDGLSNMLSDPEISQLLQMDSPQNSCRQLIAAANNQGGHDNISVIVVDLVE